MLFSKRYFLLFFMIFSHFYAQAGHFGDYENYFTCLKRPMKEASLGIDYFETYWGTLKAPKREQIKTSIELAIDKINALKNKLSPVKSSETTQKSAPKIFYYEFIKGIGIGIPSSLSLCLGIRELISGYRLITQEQVFIKDYYIIGPGKLIVGALFAMISAPFLYKGLKKCYQSIFYTKYLEDTDKKLHHLKGLIGSADNIINGITIRLNSSQDTDETKK